MYYLLRQRVQLAIILSYLAFFLELPATLSVFPPSLDIFTPYVDVPYKGPAIALILTLEKVCVPPPGRVEVVCIAGGAAAAALACCMEAEVSSCVIRRWRGS